MTSWPWDCRRCKTVLGKIIAGDTLVVTGTGVVVEKGRAALIIHCPSCGKAVAFNGPRVILNASVMGLERIPAHATIGGDMTNDGNGPSTSPE